VVNLKYALHLTAPVVAYFKLENHIRNINLLVTSTKLKFVQGVLRNETNFSFVEVTRNDDGVTLGLKPSSSQMSGRYQGCGGGCGTGDAPFSAVVGASGAMTSPNSKIRRKKPGASAASGFTVMTGCSVVPRIA